VVIDPGGRVAAAASGGPEALRRACAGLPIAVQGS